MLVFAAGMRRAGSTVIFNIARELAEISGGRALGLPDHNREKINSYFSSTKMIVVKGHALYNGFGSSIYKAKVLMSVRDLREIVCSLIRLRKTTFANIINHNVIDGYIGEQQSWNLATDVYFNRYEDWVGDLHEETKAIANYLKLDVSEESVLKIASRWSIDKSRKLADAASGTDHITFFMSDHVTSDNPHTMHEHLTEEQIEIVNDRYRWWLEMYGYAC